MAKITFTKEQQEQRMVYAMIKTHLNCAETLIKKMRDELRAIDPVIGDEAIAFAKAKVIDLNMKFKDLV